ncbi:TOBE domain-containing protein [Nostoc sp.]
MIPQNFFARGLIITKESVEHLQLQEGKQAIAVIKASDVIIATE